MAKAKPRAGELTTANFGWTKPTVGASDNAWGGYINADLDGIDSVVARHPNQHPNRPGGLHDPADHGWDGECWIERRRGRAATCPSPDTSRAAVSAAIPAASPPAPAMNGTPVAVGVKDDLNAGGSCPA